MNDGRNILSDDKARALREIIEQQEALAPGDNLAQMPSPGVYYPTGTGIDLRALPVVEHDSRQSRPAQRAKEEKE